MFKPKQKLLNAAVLCLLSGATGVVTAADTYTMPGTTTGNFDFYDAGGTYQVSSSHTDVSASINFTAGTGSLSTSTNFNGVLWSADVAEMFFYDGSLGGSNQTATFTWTNVVMYDGVDPFTTYECRRSANINGCASQEAIGWIDGSSTPQSYTFNLKEGQFALGLFFDWSTNIDIPVLAVFNIDSIDSSGNMTVSSVDTGDGADDGANGGIASDGFLDGDGVPGTRMATSPFPGQTPAFSGIFTAATNDAPVTGVVSPLSTNEDTALNLNVNASDFTISSTAFPARLYRAANKRLFIDSGTNYTTDSTSTITPSTNFPLDSATSGTLTVPVGLTYASSNSVTQNVSVTVNAQDDPPVISGTPAGVAVEGVVYSFTPTASDPDFGDTLSFTFTNLPSWITTSSSTTGEISGTPGPGDAGVNNVGVDITVTDSGGSTSVNLGAFDIFVRNNSTPTIVSGAPPVSQDTDEDALFSFTVTYDDADIGNTETLSCFISGNPAWMSVTNSSATTCTVEGTPLNDDVGTTTGIIVGVNDLALESVSSTFDVTVLNTNDAPTISAGTCTSTSIEATRSYSCMPIASDVDVGDTLTFSASGLPASGSLSIDSTTGNISGTPTNADAGVYSIVISVSDSTVTVPLASYDLTVNLYDAPPVVTNGLFKIPADTAFSGTLVDLATDPENCDCVTFRQEPASGNTSFGTVTVNADGTFIYTPDSGYNGTDAFSFIASDASSDSVKATVQLIVGTVSGETYAGSNFTMFDAGGANANGGTNDVIATWDGLFNADESDADFTHMTLSSITPYFGELWTAHHIRVFGPGTYTFDTTCTVAELEAGMGGPGQLCNNPLNAGQVEQFITMTVADGQVGAHILFDWSTNLNIDVLNVWNVNSEFDVSTNPGTGVLYNGEGYGAFPWSGAPSSDTVWRLASTDNDGDGIPGIPMVDGAFIDFNANFNLDIVSTGSNFTMFDAGGANANGGTNDVVASWDGLYNTDESDTDFTHMTLSSITPYFGELWSAHHIRVFGPGTYTFDTTCTVQELEAGMGGPGQLCNNPLNAGQVEQFITMTVLDGQVGAHILFDWSTNLNIDVLNVWNVNSEFDVSTNPGTGVIYNGEGYGPYPWSGAPSADTSWRLASTDNDGDGIPGIPMVDGAFIDFNANFNLFVGSGEICEPAVDNNFCGTIEFNTEVADPDLGGGSAYGLTILSLIWLGLGLYRRQVKI